LQSLTGRAQRIGRLAVVAVLVVSASQIVVVGRTWRWAAAMTRDGVMLMAEAAQPCGTQRRGAADHARRHRRRLRQRLLRGLRRVDRVLALAISDAAARGAHRFGRHRDHPEPGVVEIRVLRYTGNVLASDDLRNFEHRVEPGSASLYFHRSRTVDDVPGRHEPGVPARSMTPEISSAQQFYYSRGSIRPAPRHE
jgi:hypothetical protein